MFRSLPSEWCLGGDDDEDDQPSAPLWFTNLAEIARSSRVEMAMGVVICVNILTMFVQLQWRGEYSAYHLGRRGDDAGWPAAERSFEVLEFFYCAVYMVEVLARSFLLRAEYFRDRLHLFDFVVVVVTSFDVFIVRPLGLTVPGDIIAARMIRLLRIFRMAKALKFARSFTELRVIIQTLGLCVGSVFWSMLLLSIAVMAGAIFLTEALAGFIEDERNPPEIRGFVFDRFGGSFRSSYTMFEATFTGTWTKSARGLIEDVSPLYAAFWVLYVVGVNFAVMRVVAALFLKHTMAVAAVDAERQNMAKMKERQAMVDKIRVIFEEADTSGDGAIGEKEFMDMLAKPDVGRFFHGMDLEVMEVATLFAILSDEDGQADYDEFLNGVLKMHSSARTTDVIQILHQNLKTDRKVQQVLLHVDPWTRVCERG